MKKRVLLTTCGALTSMCTVLVATGTASTPGTWQPYGLDGYDVLALTQHGGYLYAAVYPSPRSSQNYAHGVWRRHEHPDSSWAQLGLEGIGVSSIWVRPDDPSIIYASVLSTNGYPQAGGNLLFQTTNVGETWRPLEPGPQGVRSSCVVGSPNNTSHMLMAVDDFLQRSVDAGATWGETADGAGVLVYDPSETSTVWTALNTEFQHGVALRSVDDGVNWDVELVIILFLGNAAIAPTGRVYIAWDSTVLSSDDDGDTWSFNPVVGAGRLYDVDVSPGSPNFVMTAKYPATVSGVWLSGDAGTTWTAIGGTLPDSLTFPDIMASVTEPGVFYVAVEGWDHPNPSAGVWRYQAEPVVSTPAPVPPRDDPARLTPRVNPATRRAAFALSVLETSVRSPLRILDAGGRLVAEIDAWRSTPAGVEAAWEGTRVDGSRAAPGVYFGVVETAQGEVTARFVWLE
jgi:hypothetical protein